MRISAVQSDVSFGHPNANASKVIDHLIHLSGQADLVVFPECFLTGYAARSLDEARQIAIHSDHEALQAIRKESDRLKIGVAVGFAEAARGELYNSISLFLPGELEGIYRKTHLPFIGYDRFATPGDKLEVFETNLGKIGILICYDQRPPEPARVLALKGADVILLPTNWPDGAQVSASTVCVARAAENKVWMVACNRIGVENGFRFIGQSKIISPSGLVVTSANEGEATLTATLDFALARDKHTVILPGEYEYGVMASRRTELYGALSVEQALQG